MLVTRKIKFGGRKVKNKINVRVDAGGHFVPST